MVMRGGLRAGDVYPGTDPAVRTKEPSSSDLPLLVWQGKLAAGTDALFLIPTVWEWDDAASNYTAWLDGVDMRSGVKPLAGHDAIIYHAYMSDDAIKGALAGQRIAIVEQRGIFASPDGDRPLGCFKYRAGFSQFECPDRVVVIEREFLDRELALGNTAGGRRPGTFEVSFAARHV